MNYLETMRRHIQNLRNSISNPSKETLAAWRLEDARHEMLRDYYSRQEDDDFDFGFTSEVKVK